MTGVVRGWCPSAYRPMMSGDGLLVRVNPNQGWLSATEVTRLCDLAEAFGNGMIDLTRRANVQLRGVSETAHADLLDALVKAGLVHKSPEVEARRIIVMGSLDDASCALAKMIEDRAAELPDLPGKVGIAINLGASLASQVPGDFRFETGQDGLILRADGAPGGVPVDPQSAVEALLDMMAWFLESGGREHGRMARHLVETPLPDQWLGTPALPETSPPQPGQINDGHVLGVAFGATTAASLRELMAVSGAKRIGVTPWRLLRLDDRAANDVPGFFAVPKPLLDVSACPGAPLCSQASVKTREIAMELAGDLTGSLHVSGCPKGCARSGPADLTLVGRDGKFDLVRNASAGDEPERRGLLRSELQKAVGA